MAFESGFGAGSQLKMVDHPLAGLIEKLTQGYKGGVEAKYLPQNLQARGLQDNLKNRILQEELKQQESLTPVKNMEAQQKQLFNKILMSKLQPYLNTEQSSNANQSNLNINPNQSVMNAYDVTQNNTDPRNLSDNTDVRTQPLRTTVVREGAPELADIDKMYFSNPILRNFLKDQGFSEKITTKESPETGQLFQNIVYPSGKIEERVFKIGEAPEDRTRKVERAKKGEDYKDALANDYSDTNALLNNLDYMENLLLQNPNAQNVIGPLNSWATKITGTEADRELLGQFANASGNIALDAAKSIKGAFTGRDMSLLNSVKPNPKDTYSEFLGKLKAMKSIGMRIQQKIEFIDNQIDKGIPRIQAEKMAQTAVKMEDIKDQVNQALKTAEKNNYSLNNQSVKNAMLGNRQIEFRNGKWVFK